MESLRIIDLDKNKIANQELLVCLFGDFMALYANANRGKGQKVFSRKDFYKLSYDTQLKKEADPELFARVARRLGSVIKKKPEEKKDRKRGRKK